MTNKTFILLITSALLLAGCKNNNSNENNNNTDINVIIKSPNEDGGMEGNADKDKVKEKTADDLKEFLNKVSNVEYYTYEITSKVLNNESHFIDHFTPNAWYEENDNNDLSFGYAQEKNTKNIFKYYLHNNEIIPSIYEYTGYLNEMVKVQDLYDVWTITHVNMLKENMTDFSAKSLGQNKYVITDSNTASIFQFMSTYGNSITNYIIATYIEIIDFSELTFKTTIDLGTYGIIEGIFTKTNNTKINFVNDAVSKGEIKGVDYHQDIYDFLNNKCNQNNFILHGIKQKIGGYESNVVPYTINCTNEYFFLDYEDPNYTDWGYALIPAYTTISYVEGGTPITQTLEYTSCYSFKKNNNGEYYIDSFIGPMSSNGIYYKEVDELPATGEATTLYIIDVEGDKIAYYYDEGWKEYSSWYDSVGDFYISNEQNNIATFYLSGSALSSIGSLYFEKSFDNPDLYYSTDSSIMGALANGLFGWGFQKTNTWMEYVKKANIKINRNENNEIESYDVGLDVEYFSNGVSAGIGQIYYTIDSFNQGNISTIDSFYQSLIGGENNE